MILKDPSRIRDELICENVDGDFSSLFVFRRKAGWPVYDKHDDFKEVRDFILRRWKLSCVNIDDMLSHSLCQSETENCFSNWLVFRCYYQKHCTASRTRLSLRCNAHSCRNKYLNLIYGTFLKNLINYYLDSLSMTYNYTSTIYIYFF